MVGFFYFQDKQVLAQLAGEIGNPLLGYLLFYAGSHNLILYNAVVFIAYLLAALYLNGVLKGIKVIDLGSRFFIVLFFMVFPVNSARIELADLKYAVSYALFFAAFYILGKYLTLALTLCQ